MPAEDRPRILVVDNLADAADTLAMLLSLWGYGVEACYDGAAALAIARAYQPHAVLLDLGMSGMDGFEVARQLREQPGMQQVVLMAYTGYGDPACRTRAREAGFQHYLVKPTDLKELHELLGRAVGHAGLPQDPGADAAPRCHRRSACATA